MREAQRREFDRLAPEIERALEYAGGTHTLEDVWTAISNGELQLWPYAHSVIITEIQQYPRLRAVHFFLAAGQMQELEAAVPGIEAWARQVGASRITLAGRKGWERSFLRARGYAPTWSVMARSLADVEG